MLERIQATADLNGMIIPGSIQAFDADLIKDPITDATIRGPLRTAVISAAGRQKIADAINAELGGEQKAKRRIQDAKKAP